MADGNGSGSLSSLLQDLKSDLLKGRIEDDFDVAGRKIRMHTLSDGEVVWRDQFVTVTSTMTLLSSQKACTLAAAVSHINGEPIEDQFNLPDDPKLKEFLANNMEDRLAHYRERLFAFLSDLPDVIVTEMFLFYKGLEERRAKVIENLKNSSKETSSSESNSTSSPAAGPPAEPVTATTETPGKSSFDA